MKTITWKKSSQQLIEFLESVIPEEEGVDRKTMFGYPCAFKNGNMFLGLHQEHLFLRLSNVDREAFLKVNQAKPFEPLPGRIMKEYVVVPSWMLKNRKELGEWIRKSLVYVSGLPKRMKKQKKGNSGSH